jgi:hypothetical protein
VTVDPITHKRYLDYRERHAYFGGKKALLGAAEFAALDDEARALEAKGEGGRDDEEEARLNELLVILVRD